MTVYVHVFLPYVSNYELVFVLRQLRCMCGEVFGSSRGHSCLGFGFMVRCVDVISCFLVRVALTRAAAMFCLGVDSPV